ncbi:MAG TPA: UbiA family prenyltransferase [Acidimicrobiales bacterium]|nr:UbiA family prenyltransferase [Acidimicrobiales bacterium]
MRPSALLRAAHPEPAAAVVVLAGALAVADGRPAAGCGAVVAAVAAGQLSVGWHNDWLDAERDRRAGRRDKPAAQGEVGRRTVGVAAAVALGATVPLSALSGWRAAVAHLVAVTVAWAYNAWLKATVLSWLPYAVAFPLLVVFVSTGRRGHPWPPWWELLVAGLLAVGAHFANAAPDVAADLAAGLRGLPARLGAERAARAALGLLLAATVVVVLAPGPPGVPAALTGAAALVVLAAGVAAGRRRGPGVAFRTAMAVALVDAAGLVAATAR